MITELPKGMRIPKISFKQGTLGTWEPEFESKFDKAIYYAGKSPIPKGKNQKVVSNWFKSLGIKYEDIKEHREKIKDKINELINEEGAWEIYPYVYVPSVSQDFEIGDPEEEDEEMPEGLDDLLGDIKEDINIEEGPKVNTKTLDIKKFLGEERYDKYYQELISEGKIDGQNLSPDERREGFKSYKKDKIDFEKFVDKVLAAKAGVNADVSQKALPTSALVKRDPNISIPSGDQLKVDEKPKEEKTDKLLENIVEINKTVTNILSSLKNQNKLFKKGEETDRKQKENLRRKTREEGLEKDKGKIGKIFKSVLKPVEGIFSRLKKFITFVLLGRALKLLGDFFGNPDNKEKIDAIKRFLKDYWPALTALIIGFGTPFGAAVRGFVKIVGALTIKLLKAIPGLVTKLVAFGIKNPLALAAGGTTLAAGALVMRSEDSSEQILEDSGKADSSPKEQAEELSKPKSIMETMSRTMLPSLNEPEVEGRSGGGLIGFNGGGMKPMGTDTVPAMLTPGEVVINKPTVDAVGAEPLLALNKQFGGPNANRPKIISRKSYASGGGLINKNNITYAKSGGLINNNNITYASSGGLINNNTTYAKNGGLINKNNITYASGGGLINRNNITYASGGGLINNNKNNITYAKNGGLINKNNITYAKSGGLINNNNITYASGGGLINNNKNNITYASGGGLINNNKNNITYASGGGLINNNTTYASGGGLINNNTTYASGGGLINNNTTYAKNGGLINKNNITYAKNGGLINKNNITYASGGGLINNNKNNITYAKNGGLINKNNITYASGGGLINNNTTYAKNGGLINKNNITYASGGGLINNNTTYASGGGLINNNKNNTNNKNNITYASGGGLINNIKNNITYANSGGLIGNQKIAYNAIQNNFPTAKPFHIAAALGNFETEAPGLKPNTYQMRGGPGRGIAQWETPGRWDTAVKMFSPSIINSLPKQLDFMKWEMNTGHPDSQGRPNLPYGRNTKREWLKSTNLYDATINFMRGYEAPSVPHTEKRIQNAQEVLSKTKERTKDIAEKSINMNPAKVMSAGPKTLADSITDDEGLSKFIPKPIRKAVDSVLRTKNMNIPEPPSSSADQNSIINLPDIIKNTGANLPSNTSGTKIPAFGIPFTDTQRINAAVYKIK